MLVTYRTLTRSQYRCVEFIMKYFTQLVGEPPPNPQLWGTLKVRLPQSWGLGGGSDRYFSDIGIWMNSITTLSATPAL